MHEAVTIFLFFLNKSGFTLAHQKGFPKILILVKTLLNNADSGACSLRNWFRDWPEESLTQIYSGVTIENQSFCGSDFYIRKGERRFGRFFFSLKNSTLSDVSQQYRTATSSKTGQHSSNKNFIAAFGDRLVKSGLWELIFPPVLSPRLRKWLDEIRPDVIFFQATDLSFMKIALDINKEYGIPICINIVDDWVQHIYTSSFISFFMTGIVRRRFKKLVQRSSYRFVIGDLMAREYYERYGYTFEPLRQCDNPERYPVKALRKPNKKKKIKIVYSGSLGNGRWECLLDLSKAIQQFEMYDIEISAYVSFVPVNAAELFKKATNIRIEKPPKDEELPGILCNADILFLPESFDAQIKSYTKFSVSTKAHLYMMSERPILVYGPSDIGTIDYAIREGWGLVVQEKTSKALQEAVKSLIEDNSLRKTLVLTGRKVALKNHNGKVVRQRLRQLLNELNESSVNR